VEQNLNTGTTLIVIPPSGNPRPKLAPGVILNHPISIFHHFESNLSTAFQLDVTLPHICFQLALMGFPALAAIPLSLLALAILWGCFVYEPDKPPGNQWDASRQWHGSSTRYGGVNDRAANAVDSSQHHDSYGGHSGDHGGYSGGYS
jgi:hypothetical protein